MANTHEVDRTLSCGSLHRLVRVLGALGDRREPCVETLCRNCRMTAIGDATCTPIYADIAAECPGNTEVNWSEPMTTIGDHFANATTTRDVAAVIHRS